MWKNVLTFTKKKNDSITIERTEMEKRPYYYGTEEVNNLMYMSIKLGLLFLNENAHILWEGKKWKVHIFLWDGESSFFLPKFRKYKKNVWNVKL